MFFVYCLSPCAKLLKEYANVKFTYYDDWIITTYDLTHLLQYLKNPLWSKLFDE